MTSPEPHMRNEKHVQGLFEELFQVVEPKNKGMKNREMIRKLEDQLVQCLKNRNPRKQEQRKMRKRYKLSDLRRLPRTKG